MTVPKPPLPLAPSLLPLAAGSLRTPPSGGLTKFLSFRGRPTASSLMIAAVAAGALLLSFGDGFHGGDGGGGIGRGGGSFRLRGQTPLGVGDPARRPQKKLRPVQFQIVHRHGDRTPITPLSDAQYWSSLLPPPSELDEMTLLTNIVRDEHAVPHPAGGGDVFGRLTEKGIARMRKLGRRVREEVEEAFGDGVGGGARGREIEVSWDEPDTWLRVSSTDFSRTVQSVQAVLQGLLLDKREGGLLRAEAGTLQEKSRANMKVDVDARHTSKMVPDPNPRRYVGQADLERELLLRPDFVRREKGMRPLAVRLTRALRESGVLGKEAEGVSFGVGEDEATAGTTKRRGDDDDGDDQDPPPLAWNQLAEILTCLRDGGRLPRSLSESDLTAAAEHNARRWFDLLGDRRLAAMAIGSLVKKMVLNAEQSVSNDRDGGGGGGALQDLPSPPPPILHVFSGHDATLIALLCAFRLDRPATWPEYGSHLKMELLRGEGEEGGDDDDTGDEADGRGIGGIVHRGAEKRKNPESHPDYYVRFSLDGVLLRSHLGDEGKATELLKWEDLRRFLDDMERDLPPLAALGG